MEHTHEQMYNRIDAMYIAAGMPAKDNWYHEAHVMVRDLASSHGIEFETCAAIVAALSPRVKWLSKNGVYVNLQAADNLIAGYRHHKAKAEVFSTVAGFNRNKQRAWDILRTNNPTLLSGPKVTAFYRNIVDPDNDENVTVDAWIIAIAYGFDLTAPKNNVASITRKRYNDIKAALTSVAQYYGISTVDLQAAVWRYAKYIAGLENYRTI